MKRDLEPITRSSRMIEAVSVGDRYSLGGSHGQAAAYPKHVHARACVTPRWRVRSNNARRNTRLYDNEAASPKLMPVYYEARPVEIDRDTFDWMPPRPNTIWLPRSAEWKFKSSRRLPVSITTLIAARGNFPEAWLRFERWESGSNSTGRCPVSAIRWFIAIEHDRAKQESWHACRPMVYRCCI